MENRESEANASRCLTCGGQCVGQCIAVDPIMESIVEELIDAHWETLCSQQSASENGQI